jgi:hypothetical protein
MPVLDTQPTIYCRKGTFSLGEESKESTILINIGRKNMQTNRREEFRFDVSLRTDYGNKSY